LPQKARIAANAFAVSTRKTEVRSNAWRVRKTPRIRQCVARHVGSATDCHFRKEKPSVCVARLSVLFFVPPSVTKFSTLRFCYSHCDGQKKDQVRFPPLRNMPGVMAALANHFD
jgi:hypothetical protein